MMKGIRVDPEFKALVFPLAEAEAAMLEESLKREGCRDALVTWRGLLLDGHHRLEVCRRRGIEFKTKEIDLEDRTAAKVWVIKNQFARRNLTPFQRAELALRLEPLIAAESRKRMVKGKKADPGAILPQGKTRDVLGKLAGVSGRTIDFARQVIEKGTEEQKELARKDSMKLYRVAAEIKHAEKTKKREKEAEAVKEAWAANPPGNDGWQVRKYRDKWGNKCIEKVQYNDLGLGDKNAHFSRNEVVEYAPGYKEVHDGQADVSLWSLFNDLGNGLRKAASALDALREKHGSEKTRAAYRFDEDAPRPGWTNWGNEDAVLQPGDPPPLNIEEAKRYLWPEAVGLLKKFQKALQKIGMDGGEIGRTT